MGKNWRRFLPFIILIVLVSIVYITNIHTALTLENLKKEQNTLTSFVKDYPLLSPLIFIGFYTLSVCLVIPDSVILTILGGMIFPFPLAVLYACLSETVGAILFFAIFYSAFSNSYTIRERPFLKKMRKKFLSHPAVYLLFLRLSHILPFWLINFSSAYFRVRYWTFIWTCLIGVAPLTYLLADAGHTISNVFKQAGPPSLADIFTTKMKILLILISLISFVPIIYKNLIKKGKKR